MIKFHSEDQLLLQDVQYHNSIARGSDGHITTLTDENSVTIVIDTWQRTFSDMADARAFVQWRNEMILRSKESEAPMKKRTLKIDILW